MNQGSDQSWIDYHLTLTASIGCVKFLLLQGVDFRVFDGSNFELLKLLAAQNGEINRIALGYPPGHFQMVASSIQKDIIKAIAVETTNVIIRNLADDLFSILVVEACDISLKEKMAVVLRFVDDRGFTLQRFLGVVQVAGTTSLSLKMNIDALLCKHGLSISSLRGQGYFGASSVSDDRFKELKSLIMMENQSAYYAHWFAHQLQFSLVIVAQGHSKVRKFFDSIYTLMNFVGEFLSGSGQSEEVSSCRVGAKYWSSHYKTLLNLISLFGPTVDMLMAIGNETKVLTHRTEANSLAETIQCFEFIFCLFLMKDILGISNDLSQALQRRDQDIVNAMTLVKITKELLQEKRSVGRQSFWKEVASFCTKHGIIVPNEQDIHVTQGRSRRNVEKNTVRHYYHFDFFNEVIDRQLQELNARFDEVNTELLLCMSCLDPSDRFLAFDKRKLIRFAEFYPKDFSGSSIIALENQLDIYIKDVRSNDEFASIKGINELSRKLVQMKKHYSYNWVYLLLKLALLLPVAKATAGSVYSTMKILKNSYRLGDDEKEDCLAAYLETDIVNIIKTEDIIVRYQDIKKERANQRMLL